MGKRMYVTEDMTLKDKLLKEERGTKLNIHLGSTKIYKDFKELYWWPNIEK